MQVISFVTLTN